MTKTLKKIIIIFCLLLSCYNLTSQNNNTVEIDDEVYSILDTMNTMGICNQLSINKPYTKKYINKKLLECIEYLSENYEENKKEIDVISYQLERFKEPNEKLDLKQLNYNVSGSWSETFPVSFNMSINNQTFMSGGVYSDKSNNSFGYEIANTLLFYGNIGKNISYSSLANVIITKMPMTKLGEYDIGYWWYDNNENYDGSELRKINTYRNYSVSPYSYKKKWDGSVYYLNGGVNAEGLTGWAFQDAFGFGMLGEIHSSFFDDRLIVALGRINREWGAMNENSSLVLNSQAQPFFAIETSISLFNWLTMSSLTGFLEFPNQRYINSNAWYVTDGNANRVSSPTDSFFFHNMLSIAMLEMNFKHFHFDFGSTVIYPNRFELGYSFPLIDKVVYQNSMGDYDNLGLFANAKLSYPGLGYLWGSFYLDEMNSLTAKIFSSTRCMFAYQGGGKVIIPFIPFTSVSLSYTKIEPYCYTHQALNSTYSQPYYPNYISESYTNNGYSLGYYLPPNSDEIKVVAQSNPLPAFQISLAYQLIRHGVDWGDKANIFSGSSIYSELPTGEIRKELEKYFLHDGTYEWMNVITLSAEYDLNNIGLPCKIMLSSSYVHNWFTTISNDEDPGYSTEYYSFTSPDYIENRGFVFSLGLKIFTD